MTTLDLIGLQIEATRVREGSMRALGLALDGADGELVHTFKALLESAMYAEKMVLATIRKKGKVIPINRKKSGR